MHSMVVVGTSTPIRSTTFWALLAPLEDISASLCGNLPKKEKYLARFSFIGISPFYSLQMDALSKDELLPKVVEAYSRPTRIIRGKDMDADWEVIKIITRVMVKK